MTAVLEELAQNRTVQGFRTRGLAAVDAVDRMLARDSHWWIAVAALLCLQIVLALGHEPWFDELQALLIATESKSLAQLLGYLRYEGHPPLWYLWLNGVSRLTGPEWVLPVAVLAVGLPAQACILFKAPFIRGERLLLCAGSFLLFEFFTISRGASLGVALCIMAAACWRSRAIWLILALLPLCDMLFGVISGILVILRWHEKLWSWIGSALWLACGMLAAWTVRPAPDLVPALEPESPFLSALDFVQNLGTLLFPFQTNGLIPRWDGVAPLWLGVFLAIGFLRFAWLNTAPRPLQRQLFFGMVGYCFLFSVAIYNLPVRHLMLLAVLLVLLAWLRARDGEALSTGMRLWLLTGAACGIVVAAINLAVPFDTSDKVARVISERGLENKLWMAFPDSEGLGVGVYARTGMRFHRPERRCVQGFVRWNYRSAMKNRWHLYRYLDKESREIGGFYILTSMLLKSPPAGLVQPISFVPRGYNGREYFMYRVAPDLPDANPSLRSCAPE